MRSAKFPWAAIGSLLLLAAILSPSAAVAQPVVPGPKPPPNPTMTCKFASGPLAGQTKSYRSTPGAAPLAEGAPCTDGAGSIGVAVPDATTPNPTSAATVAQTGPRRCSFTTGPRAGQSGDVDRSAAVGAPCSDGKGSSGVAR